MSRDIILGFKVSANVGEVCPFVGVCRGAQL